MPMPDDPAMSAPRLAGANGRAEPMSGGTLTAANAAPTRGALMRPSLNILDPQLTARIVDEAMRVLAEVGMEIRGPEMQIGRASCRERVL